MANFIEKSAKTKEEAIELALLELGLTEADVEIEVIDEGSKGFLGIGGRDAVVKVSYADNTSNRAQKFLDGIFSILGEEVAVDVKENGKDMSIELSGPDMGVVIGKRGDTLDSLQYLASLVENKGKSRDEYTRVTIDTEGYRQKREDSLKALSERLANKVAKSGKKYTLEPMTPYERRIIHANLQGNEEVTTFSIGEEPYRKVVIAPKNEKRKPTYKKSAPKKVLNYFPDEDLPTTYAGGGQPQVNKASSFEEYLAEHLND